MSEDTNKKDLPKEEEKKDSPEPKEEASSAKEKKKPSAKFKDIIEKIEGLSALELAELVKELEDRFGVSAAAPVVTGGTAAPAAGGEAEAAEEKSSYNVILSSGGSNKIAAIKAIREILPDLGLKEAKDLVEGAPKPIKEDVAKEEAEKMKAKLEEAGAKVELQ